MMQWYLLVRRQWADSNSLSIGEAIPRRHLNRWLRHCGADSLWDFRALAFGVMTSVGLSRPRMPMSTSVGLLSAYFPPIAVYMEAIPIVFPGHMTKKLW